METTNKLRFVLLRTFGRIFKNTIKYSYFWLKIEYYNFVCHIYENLDPCEKRRAGLAARPTD
jgi:hypothetical protein